MRREKSSGSSQGTLHVLDVLETVAQIADERVIHVLEHSSFSDDIADAFGANDCMRLLASPQQHNRGLLDASSESRLGPIRTFIFPYVFQRKRQPGILALDDADLSKGASADDS